MTDLGIRASALGGHAVTPSHVERWAAPATSRPGSFLHWDLPLVAVAYAVLVATWSVTVPVGLVVLVVWGACLAVAGAGHRVVLDSRGQELARVLRAGAFCALTGSALSLVPQASLTTGQAFALSGAAAACSCAVRLAGRVLGREPARVLVVGGAKEREHAVTALTRQRGDAVEVVTACLASDRHPAPAGEIAISAEELPGFARYVGAGSVVAVPGPGLDDWELRRLRWLLEKEQLTCFVATSLLGVAAGRTELVDVGGVPLVRADTGRRRGFLWWLAGWSGRVLAALALVLAAPLLLLLMAAIRLESPGPAVFRQTRVGQDGRTFTIYKLRTMVDEPLPEAALTNDFDGVLFKMRQDPRVTPLGRWLRKFSLDELPQLVNVVRGQMRLVGPRPALPEEVAEYTEDERRRLAVPPGITGLWQVSGRSDLTWEETVRLDLHYVDNWSTLGDLLILCRTVSAVLRHRGAY